MASREEYDDRIRDILIKQYGWTEEEASDLGVTIGHCFMKGLTPERVAAALENKRRDKEN